MTRHVTEAMLKEAERAELDYCRKHGRRMERGVLVPIPRELVRAMLQAALDVEHGRAAPATREPEPAMPAATRRPQVVVARKPRRRP